MIWFGVCDSISAPELTKMRRPSTTKALKRRLVDDDDLHVLLGEAGGAQDRRGVVAQELLDLGVADDRRRPVFLRRRRERGQRDRRGRNQRRRAAQRGNKRKPPRDIGRRNHDDLSETLNRPAVQMTGRKPNPKTRRNGPYIAGFGSRANTLKALNRARYQAVEYGNKAAPGRLAPSSPQRIVLRQDFSPAT